MMPYGQDDAHMIQSYAASKHFWPGCVYAGSEANSAQAAAMLLCQFQRGKVKHRTKVTLR